MRKASGTYSFWIAGLMIVLVIAGCLLESWPDTQEAYTSTEVEIIQDWNRHALVAERYAEGFRVPVVARFYAYLGIAAFETSRWKVQVPYALNGLPPQWQKPAVPDSIYLPAALHACYHGLMKSFFSVAPYQVIEERNALHAKWNETFDSHPDHALMESSTKYGEMLAEAVYAWSATDSLGHMAQLHNYDRSYAVPSEPGNWHQSVEIPMPPLLPYWGNVRTFTASVQDFPVDPFLEYSEEKGSDYYNELYELYALSSPLSEENIWIAEFWSDDHPGLTFSPAGRWISIALQVVDQSKPSFETAIETYLKCGIALSDAAVVCWHGKYQYLSERPVTYIRKMIDPAWKPLHDAPPFPGYPSGHSTMGAAVAEVLTAIYGEQYAMTDRSHESRKEFRSASRTFSSFAEMAKENAFSRLALGVHIRSDCEEGLRLGALIGKKVASLPVQDPLAGG